MRRFSHCLCLATLLWGLMGCTSVLVNTDSWGQSGADHRSSAQIQTDAQINAAVVSALIRDRSVDSTRIQVDTRRSVVSLTGQVSSAAERHRAVSLAQAVSGVRQVVPRLVVVQ